MVRIYPPPDDSADEIARELRIRQGLPDFAVPAIAAALRAYGASQRNGLLEEIASGIGDDGHVDGAYLRSLKSTPESKPESKEPTA